MKRLILTAVLGLYLALSAARLPAAAASPGESGGLCVALAIDDSESMQRSDPHNLRSAGARVFVALLDRGDQVGLLSFAERPTRLTPSMVLLDGAGQQQELLGRVSARAPHGYTDLRLALIEALDLLQSAAGCQERRLVLLSDGQPDLPGGLPENYEQDAVQIVQKAGIPLLGIALTQAGEIPLLYRLALASGSQGAVLPARDAGALLDAYLDALGRIQDRTVLAAAPPDEQGFLSLPLAPGLAQHIERAAFILALPTNGTTPRPELTAPGGEKLSANDPRLGFVYAGDPRLAVYTMNQPAPGDWGFQLPAGTAARGWLLLRSRLRVHAVEPQAYHPQGQPLRVAASLVERQPEGTQTVLIGSAAFSARLQLPDGSQAALDRLYDDGTHGDAQAGDGIYSGVYPNTTVTGEYRLEITAYQGLIPARLQRRVQVIPFPAPVQVEPAGLPVESRGQPLELALRLQGGSPPQLDSGGFALRTRGPSGQQQTIPLMLQGDLYRAAWLPPQPGRYSLEFLPQAAFYKGVPYPLSLRSQVEIRQAVIIALPDPGLDLSVVDVEALEQGIGTDLRLDLSGSASERVQLDLAGPPGLKLANYAPRELRSGSNIVHLSLHGRLAPGSYAAVLVLSSRPGVEQEQRSLPLRLQIYQPVLALVPQPPDPDEISAAHRTDPLPITLTVQSHSLRTETFHLELAEQGRLLAQAQQSVRPGDQVQVRLGLPAVGLTVGEHRLQAQLTSRPGIHIDAGEAELVLRITPGPWCGSWCGGLAGSGALALLCAAGWTAWRLSRPRPWGTLQPRQSPSGAARLAPITLRQAGGWLSSGPVIAGSGRGAHIRLKASGVQPLHAAFKPIRRPVMERIGRPPRSVAVHKTSVVVCNLSSGLLRAGGVDVPRGGCSAPLTSGMRVQIGPYEFEYRE
jgi:hypothetical protein